MTDAAPEPDNLPAAVPPTADELDLAAAGPQFSPEAALELRRRASAALAFVGLPSPEEFETLLRLSKGLAESGLMPKPLQGKEGAVMTILLKGRELGVPPMAAVSNIHVVEGKPGLSGSLMMALVQRAGHEVTITDRTIRAATVRGRRYDTGAELAVTWTWEMAQKAGLVGKEVWQKYPADMLTWRAVGALCRLLFADVLLGAAYTPEELGAEVDSSGVATGWDVAATRAPAPRRAAAAVRVAGTGAGAPPPPAADGDEDAAQPAKEQQEEAAATDDAADAAAAPAAAPDAAGEAQPTPPPAAASPPPPPPPTDVMLRMVDIACERLKTRPTRLMAALAVRIQRNYEDATPDELWAFLRTDVARRLREVGMDLPDPEDVVLPEPDAAAEEADGGVPAQQQQQDEDGGGDSLPLDAADGDVPPVDPYE